MENKLKNLRSSMNHTVLKNGRMSQAEKKRLSEQAINKSYTQKNKNLLGPILSVAVTMVFLLTIGSFTYYNLFPDNRSAETSPSDRAVVETTRETTTIANEEEQPTQGLDEKEWKDVTVLEQGAHYDMPTNARAYIASANRSIQTKPAADSKLTQRGFDDMYYYYLESMSLQNGLNIIKVQGTDIEKDFNNLYSLTIMIQEEQGKRLDGVNLEGVSKFDAHKYWKEPSEEMSQSVVYLQKLLNDLDMTINHDGKGEIHGFSYQGDGDKTAELQNFIDVYFGF
ncbi:hypothetical protein J7I80_18280 [Bacillus sp. ISL-41]|uniref:hypothetical protein n=1 Tax=Bacillus sp. ISL-41 TaxID=2819127 RepID=UPI001BE6D534|nr:hypothetical protein [Bacillus sp. ISL-41]MBT2644197.1 hypothetical protein [Bacillus sp. ISL-41]